jgi:hypothetical protein
MGGRDILVVDGSRGVDQVYTTGMQLPGNYAVDNERVLPSRIYVAPGGDNRLVERGCIRVLRSPKSIRVSPALMPHSAPHRLQRGEIVGHPLSIFDAPDDAAPARVRNELEVAGAKGRCEDERWQTRQGGCRFWASSVIAALHNEVRATTRVRESDARHERA